MTVSKYSSMVLIHYGSSHFEMSRYHPIREWSVIGWTKPLGGLWTSPVNSKFGWRQWCEANQYKDDFNEWFKLKYNGNTIVIDSVKDLDKLPWKTSEKILTYPRFEPLMEQGVDAIFLTERGQWKTRLSHPKNLYGWDCETVLILNPKSIVEIPKMRLAWAKKKTKKVLA